MNLGIMMNWMNWRLVRSCFTELLRVMNCVCKATPTVNSLGLVGWLVVTHTITVCTEKMPFGCDGGCYTGGLGCSSLEPSYTSVALKPHQEYLLCEPYPPASPPIDPTANCLLIKFYFSLHLGIQSGPCEDQLIKLDEQCSEKTYKVAFSTLIACIIEHGSF